MRALVVYDSIFGNTARIAGAIAEALGGTSLPVSSAKAVDWSSVDLLVVGSPTRGFRPTPAMAEFCAGLDFNGLPHPQTAVFDTRISLDAVHPAPLRWVVDAGGYAADRMEQLMNEHGAKCLVAPEGFVVNGQEGPLAEGEVERARDWAAAIVRQATSTC